MRDPRLDTATRRAIAECVRTVEELDVLLCLARDRGRYSSAATIAAQVRLTAGRTTSALEALASRNLLDVRIADAVLYRLDPATKTIGGTVAQVIEIGRRRRADVDAAIGALARRRTRRARASGSGPSRRPRS